jgi:outer membrane protein assembly factor BamB
MDPSMNRLFKVSSTFFLLAAVAAADNWPGWRGPNGDGKSAEKNLPTTWSNTKNVKWKVNLPEKGHAAPVVWGKRIFLAQPLDAKGKERALWCLDRADGKRLWEQVVPYDDKEPKHATGTYCAATPVTDGERVIVSFGSAGLYCYDFAGKEQWHYDLGKLWHVGGNASSPVLYQNLVILWAGPGERQFLIALDKTTGKKAWQHDEPGGKSGVGTSDWVASWATPLIARVADHDELILAAPKKLKAFDPKTGKELWACDGLGDEVYPSPVISADGIVVAFSGYRGPALACKAGGSGDVTKTHRLWHHKDKGNPQRIGSPVLVGDHCYLVGENGVANCIEIKTGKDLWKARLTRANTWSSVLFANGKLYVQDFDANTYLVDASPKFAGPTRNSLGNGEQTRSTMAFSDGEVFIRTFRHLWCISEKK